MSSPHQPAEADRLAAALAGRYRIERELGAGGMATVYLAADAKHGRRVALKVLRPELARTIATDRFLREISITARLDHPHILPLLDSGDADGLLYYAMPLVEGESLRDLLRRQPQLPLDDALRIAREVADALAYAHAHDVVHRDIKPDNILLSDGHARVADFGIARALSAAVDTLTETGLALGTAHYMSPEQASGETVDSRTDLYALGCVLYEMLAGQPPFAGATAQIVLRQHMIVDAPPLTVIRPGVTPEVANAISRVMAKSPADRFATAAEFAAALSSKVSPTPRARRTQARAGAAVTLAAVLVTSTILYLTREPLVTAAATMAVIPFRPAGADSALERLGRELAITMSATLDGVGGIRTADAMTVLADARSRERAPTLGEAAAIGQRLNSQSIVFGTLVRAGPAIQLHLSLYRTSDLEPLARGIQITGSPDDIAALTDSATLSLLRQVWRTGEAPSPSLGAITTQSVPALRAFLEGEQLLGQYRFPEAVIAFTRAIAADSTFWLAYWRVAFVRGWHGAPVDSTYRIAIREHLHLFPERDRLLIQSGDSASLSERLVNLRAINARFPDYWPAWLQYADQLIHSAPALGSTYDDSRVALERLIALNPDIVPAWDHLLWVAVYQRDSVTTARSLAALRRLGYDSLGGGPGNTGEYGHYVFLDELVRRRGTLGTVTASGVASLVAEYRGPIPAEALAGGGFTLFEFHRAQVDMAKRLLAHSPAPTDVSMNWFALAQAWAARGAWDSAMVAAERYAEAAPGAASVLAGYGLAAVGSWLGGVDSAVTRGWLGRMEAASAGLTPADLAEVAWLSGVAAAARRDGAGIRLARSHLDGMTLRSAPYLQRSLAAFEQEVAGQRRQAADSLSSLELELANQYLLRPFSRAHPYLAAVNRLSAGRWLTEAGDYSRAAALLTWYEAVLPNLYLRASNTGRMLAPIAYFERARLHQAWGQATKAQAHYQSFLDRYDLPVPARRWMVDTALAGTRGSGGR